MKGNLLKSGSMALLLVLLAGCSTVTISERGTAKISSAPTYEDRKNFFLWGLVGEHDVYVKQICSGKPARQMQSQDTFVDGLLGLITLGIYAPRTAKVWCE